MTGRRFSVPHRGAYALTSAPRAVRASLDERGIQLNWEAVPPVEGGFNPGGAYLIRVVDANLPASMRLFGPLYEDRGAASVPRYQIPWSRLFRPPTATGLALDELPDGQYQIEVWAVTTRPSSGDECRAIYSGETIRMVISQGNITLTLADGQLITGIIGEAPAPVRRLFQ